MIIGAVPMQSDAVFQEFDPADYYVICADGGYDNAVRFGIRPDLVIGDFDSVRNLPSTGTDRSARRRTSARSRCRCTRM